MTEIPDHGKPADLALDAASADYEAGLAWRAGDLPAAARLIKQAWELAPEKTDLWASRMARVLDAASTRDLQTQTNTRLAVAGIGPDDPGVRQWAEYMHSLEIGQ